MKKSFFIFFLFVNIFLSDIAYSNEKIVFIDIDLIINTSKAGKDVNTQMQKVVNEKNKIFKEQETKLIEKEQKLISQKNLLKEEEFNVKINSFKKEYNEYINKKKKTLQNLDKANKEAKLKIYDILKQILAEYSSKNDISMIVDKKNVIIGNKKFEITNLILDELNNKIKNVKLNL